MNKILWIDTETAGTDEKKHALLDISVLIEIEGQVLSEKKFKIRPFPGDIIDDEALKVNSYTREMITQDPFKPGEQIHKEITSLFELHVDKFDKTDKMYVGGYNVRFDLDFLSALFIKCKDDYLGSWINWRPVDPMSVLSILTFQQRLVLPNLKLETACNHYGIALNSHDSMSDIKATRELYYKLFSKDRK